MALLKTGIRSSILFCTFLIFLSLFIVSTAFGQIRLPKLISDGMVLQRDMPLQIRGWASPGENITMTFRDHAYKTKTGTDGNWKILLPPQHAGGPWDMVFRGKNTLKVSNILFGDVWICSGQSNMVLPMERVKEKYREEIAGSNNPAIRHFFIPASTNLQHQEDDLPSGNWKQANPADVLSFSAVAYFFAKFVYEKYHIPLGLINSSVGGTPIEAWMSEPGLQQFPVLSKILVRNKDTAFIRAIQRKKIPSGNSFVQQDQGLTEKIKWYDTAYVPQRWHSITIPGYWEDQGVRDLNGVVWYRKELEIPQNMTGVPAKLYMGRIVDADFVYVNGKQVGNTTYQYPPRRYELPAGTLKPGKNIIVIRVINTAGKGGFVPDKPYHLDANGQSVDLRGEWMYKVGEAYPPVFSPPVFSAQNQPSALYNAMIAPLKYYPVKGILWYQGESNTGDPQTYRKLLPALINDWRNQWNQRELPFLYVQLANFMEVDYLPAESKWAELRDAQLQSLSMPHTAMTVAIDLGEWNDIHPLNKKDVGERLALGAFRLAYGDTTVVYSGPVFKSFTVAGDKIKVSFNHTGSGLISGNGENLSRFEIAGADNKYFSANAEISGERVVVWSKDVPHPENVRYAWADNPDGANLYNREGLPASPFRTFNPDSVNAKPWHGKTCAVVLTYDDALNVHLDNAIPLLDSLGLKATFYIPGAFQGFQKRVDEWRKAAQNGHELGNHTLFHPCNGKMEGRNWVNPEYDLSKYSVTRLMDEVRINNLLLTAIDGKHNRTFAYTCGDVSAGDEPFTGEIGGMFIAARGVKPGMQSISTVNINNIDSYVINGESGEKLVSLVTQAMKTQSLLVFLFHGVGGEHNLNVSLSAHRQLLQFLKLNEDKVWTTTLLEAATHISKYRID